MLKRFCEFIAVNLLYSLSLVNLAFTLALFCTNGFVDSYFLVIPVNKQYISIVTDERFTSLYLPW